MTRPSGAPSEIRMPISFVRSVTTYARRPYSPSEVDKGKDGGVTADAERQREDDGEREARALPQAARAVPDVADHILDIAPRHFLLAPGNVSRTA
jgi:hypothetical protein